jgi:hypothetical protein
VKFGSSITLFKCFFFKLIILSLICLSGVVEASPPLNLVVSSGADNGPGTLRDAINQVNQHATDSGTVNTINFNIPDPNKVTLTSGALPTITQPLAMIASASLTVDAGATPGSPLFSSNNPLILNGNNIGTASNWDGSMVISNGLYWQQQTNATYAGNVTAMQVVLSIIMLEQQEPH